MISSRLANNGEGGRGDDDFRVGPALTRSANLYCVKDRDVFPSKAGNIFMECNEGMISFEVPTR